MMLSLTQQTESIYWDVMGEISFTNLRQLIDSEFNHDFSLERIFLNTCLFMIIETNYQLIISIYSEKTLFFFNME
ncbi:hypothetical protein BpHYR1_020231 [Brachionus plicatilis]|uniref:Uncharacterized protein n=1 Tax=Brachionus plicatilis TaxID=10195 RepID=A0A3M7RHV2_BRAPC|nr:hypothetical protein BpHYR1_020231 [Brachionus plicatilis]